MTVILAECYVEDFETGGIDHDHEVLQVTADTLKRTELERGEDRACWRRPISAMPLTTRLEAEFHGKRFELGQHGQGIDDRHNFDVPLTARNFQKRKLDKVSYRR